MLKTNVKASRITNLTDARYFSAWEVKYIGFNFEEGHESFIQPVQVKAMKEWLEGPQFVAEFGSFPDVAEVAEVVKFLELNMIQVGNLCSLETVKELSSKGISIIKEITWNEESNWESIQTEYQSFSSFVKLFLIDFSQNNYSIEGFTDSLKEVIALHPTLIDANLEASSIESFLEEMKPFGLAVKGGDEEKVGYKSFDDVDDIFEALEIFV